MWARVIHMLNCVAFCVCAMEFQNEHWLEYHDTASQALVNFIGYLGTWTFKVELKTPVLSATELSISCHRNFSVYEA